MVDYHVVDGPMSASSADLEASLTALGADGWRVIEAFPIHYQQRRMIFKKVDGVVEYLVADANTGRTPEETEAAMDIRGSQGWELVQIFEVKQDRRRAIYARGLGGGGGTGGGIPEAPLDDKTYGRMNAAWNRALAYDNDLLDGGNF